MAVICARYGGWGTWISTTCCAIIIETSIRVRILWVNYYTIKRLNLQSRTESIESIIRFFITIDVGTKMLKIAPILFLIVALIEHEAETVHPFGLYFLLINETYIMLSVNSGFLKSKKSPILEFL